MSDHSHESNESQNPIAKFLGVIFLFLIPAAFIVMLGVVGFYFIGGIRETPPAVTNAPAPAAPETGGGEGEGTEPATVADAGQAEIGKKAYQTCMACHGPDGKGMKAGALSMAPSLVGSELLLHENPDVGSLIIIKGIAKEGTEYMGMMAGLGAALDDEKIAAVLTYTRTNFGNSGTPITTEQVAAARAKYADLNVPLGIKRGEILKTVGAE